MAKRLTRLENQERTKGLLIESAYKMIVKKGYEAASVRDISEGAGFSIGAFYSNFLSKDAFVLELAQRHFFKMKSEIEALLDRAEADPKKSMGLLESWLNSISYSSPESILDIELELHSRRNRKFAKSYSDLIARHEEAMTEIFTRILSINKFKTASSARQISSGLIALTRGLCLTTRSDHNFSAGDTLALFVRAMVKYS